MWRTGAVWLLPWTFCLTARESGKETLPKVPSLERSVHLRLFCDDFHGIEFFHRVYWPPLGFPCAPAGVYKNVQQVWQPQESEGGQLLRPESHTVPSAHLQHPAALMDAGLGRHHGKRASLQLAGKLLSKTKTPPLLN